MTEPGQRDYNVYAYNKEAKAFFKKSRLQFFFCPAELTFKELKERDCDGDEMLVYGRIPVMTSTQCLKKVQDTVRKRRSFLRYVIARGKNSR